MDDREKVIKGLECCIQRDPDDEQRCSECPYEGNCVNRLKMDALELLKAQEPGWISVKDRLPEEGVYVLVWETQGFAYCDMLKSGVWNIGGNNGAIISHWMPLPEPPKEEN